MINKTYKEIVIERLVDTFHKAEQKGFITEDHKFIDVTRELEVYRNLTKHGLYFSVKIGETTINYSVGKISFEFETFEAHDNFRWSIFLADFEGEVDNV